MRVKSVEKLLILLKRESLVRMGQGIIYVLVGLLFNLRKASDEVA